MNLPYKNVQFYIVISKVSFNNKRNNKFLYGFTWPCLLVNCKPKPQTGSHARTHELNLSKIKVCRKFLWVLFNIILKIRVLNLPRSFIYNPNSIFKNKLFNWLKYSYSGLIVGAICGMSYITQCTYSWWTSPSIIRGIEGWIMNFVNHSDVHNTIFYI